MKNNREVVHNGVVDNSTPKPSKMDFNLTDNIHVSKNTDKSTPDNKTFGNKTKNSSWVNLPKCEHTPLGEPLDMVYKNLLQNQIITLLDNSHPYDPQPWSTWWNENAYCEYHKNRGHKTNDCIKLCHKVRDLIDDGEIVVGGHNKNSDHKAFKEPFQHYDKGETSKQKNNNEVNYTYTNDDNIINMV